MSTFIHGHKDETSGTNTLFYKKMKPKGLQYSYKKKNHNTRKKHSHREVASFLYTIASRHGQCFSGDDYWEEKQTLFKQNNSVLLCARE